MGVTALPRSPRAVQVLCESLLQLLWVWLRNYFSRGGGCLGPGFLHLAQGREEGCKCLFYIYLSWHEKWAWDIHSSHEPGSRHIWGPHRWDPWSLEASFLRWGTQGRISHWRLITRRKNCASPFCWTFRSAFVTWFCFVWVKRFFFFFWFGQRKELLPTLYITLMSLQKVRKR